ncbi:MAG: 5-(carboxyamino)imidazole ribonucleotide mutase [Bacteroidales bacterium]
MNPLVGVVMGSTSDLPVMNQAIEFLNEMEIPFEINALSAHRVPSQVAHYAATAQERGLKVVIAGAGGAAHLPGVIAAYTSLPVIGVPINSSNSIEGIDSLLSIVQMPAGIPVATVGVDGAKNGAILALQILALADNFYLKKLNNFKASLASKVEDANRKLGEISYNFRVK